MTSSEFSEAAAHIAEFLGATAPTATKLMAWMPKVENIPTEAISYIIEKITDDADRMPANLPKAFRQHFRAWQMEHPEKVARVVEQGCRDCEHGILFLEKDGQTAAIFCQCYSGDAGYLGRTTLAYMERQGWRSTKSDKLGPDYVEKSQLKAQMSQARHDERYPHPERYDGYEDRCSEGW